MTQKITKCTSATDTHDRSRARRCKAAAWTCLLVASALSLPASADDETFYFTAQVGSSSSSMKNIDNVGGSFEPGTTATDLSLNNSTLFGMKTGFYSRKGLLGFEAEVFRTRPSADVQTQTFNEPTFGPFPQTRGASHTVTALAFNVIARQPLTQNLVAHVGLGPGLFRSELQFDREQAQADTRVGLNTQLGLTYFITKQFMISAEWKHNAVRFEYPTHGTTEGFRSDYKANHFVLGFSYAFDWVWPWVGPNLRGKLGLDPVHIGPKQ